MRLAFAALHICKQVDCYYLVIDMDCVVQGNEQLHVNCRGREL